LPPAIAARVVLQQVQRELRVQSKSPVMSKPDAKKQQNHFSKLSNYVKPVKPQKVFTTSRNEAHSSSQVKNIRPLTNSRGVKSKRTQPYQTAF
jgi:hypothetical protein